MAKKTSGKPAQAHEADPGPVGVKLSDMTHENYDGPKVLGSIDVDSRAGKRMIINAQSPPYFQPDKLKGKVFKLVNWVAEVKSYTDTETRETRDAVTITMLDEKGRTCRFGSEAVTRSFDTIRAMYGDGPYTPPLFLRIEPYKTRNARNSYTVIEVDEATVKAADLAE